MEINQSDHTQHTATAVREWVQNLNAATTKKQQKQ